MIYDDPKKEVFFKENWWVPNIADKFPFPFYNKTFSNDFSFFGSEFPLSGQLQMIVLIVV